MQTPFAEIRIIDYRGRVHKLIVHVDFMSELVVSCLDHLYTLRDPDILHLDPPIEALSDFDPPVQSGSEDTNGNSEPG